MKPQLKQTFGNYLLTYLNASFYCCKLSIAYNTDANTFDQLQTLAILCVGASLVMHNTNATFAYILGGMLVAWILCHPCGFYVGSSLLSQPVTLIDIGLQSVRYRLIVSDPICFVNPICFVMTQRF